jgi:hypothetical protein
MTETIAPSIFHADIQIETSTKYSGAYIVTIDGLGLADLKAQYKELRAAVPYDADSQCLLDILQDVILEIEAFKKGLI